VLDEAAFSEAVLDEAAFSEAVLDEAAFSEAVLGEAAFSEAVLGEAVFKRMERWLREWDSNTALSLGLVRDMLSGPRGARRVSRHLPSIAILGSRRGGLVPLRYRSRVQTGP